MRGKGWVRLLLAVCCAFALAAQAALRICVKCGHEGPDEAEVCPHCSAPLPPLPAEPAAATGETVRARATGVCLDGRVVDEEIALARKRLAAGESEVARLFARNALALDTLTDRSGHERRTAAVAELVQLCTKRSRGVARRCSECDGTGKSYAAMTALDGSSVRREVPGRSCALCDGTGVMTAPATVDEQKRARGEAWRAYATAQSGRQYVPIGNAWVPADARDRLSVPQTAMLLCSTASPCEDCMGFGSQDCEACQGLGTVKCRARGCVKGTVEVERRGQLSQGTMKHLEKCKVCSGKGIVDCDDCRGKGWVLCKECQGSGERPICARCSGQGCTTCSKCAGTGQVKGAACAACGGQGTALCPGCKGDGRRR